MNTDIILFKKGLIEWCCKMFMLTTFVNSSMVVLCCRSVIYNDSILDPCFVILAFKSDVILSYCFFNFSLFSLNYTHGFKSVIKMK